MALDAEDFLPRVVALALGGIGVFDALRVDDGKVVSSSRLSETRSAVADLFKDQLQQWQADFLVHVLAAML